MVREKPTMDVLKVIAYSHALDIMSCIDGGKRFTDIEKELDLNPNIVNMRLKDLRMAQLAEKKDRLYQRTERGEKVLELAKQLEAL